MVRGGVGAGPSLAAFLQIAGLEFQARAFEITMRQIENRIARGIAAVRHYHREAAAGNGEDLGQIAAMACLMHTGDDAGSLPVAAGRHVPGRLSPRQLADDRSMTIHISAPAGSVLRSRHSWRMRFQSIRFAGYEIGKEQMPARILIQSAGDLCRCASLYFNFPNGP